MTIKNNPSTVFSELCMSDRIAYVVSQPVNTLDEDSLGLTWTEMKAIEALRKVADKTEDDSIEITQEDKTALRTLLEDATSCRVARRSVFMHFLYIPYYIFNFEFLASMGSLFMGLERLVAKGDYNPDTGLFYQKRYLRK